MTWLIVLAGIVSNAGASLLVKLATTPPFVFPSLGNPGAALRNWPFWGGLALYGMAFLLYAASLARLPMNVAHPVMTCGAVAMVALVSGLVLREPFQWTTLVGIGLVMAGVALITARVA